MENIDWAAIITAAAESPQGIVALAIVAIFLVVLFLFRSSSERVKLSIFSLLLMALAFFVHLVIDRVPTSTVDEPVLTEKTAPLNKFENDLSRHKNAPSIIVHSGQKYVLKTNQTKLVLSRLTLENNAVLVLPRDSKKISISAVEMYLSKGASIVSPKGTVISGRSGNNGSKATGRCKVGGYGKNGENGADGRPAPSLELNVVELFVDKTVSIFLEGENGGRGGNGGSGGDGSKASRSDSCGGGDGGTGGSGGRGGKGSDGGSLKINYVRAFDIGGDQISFADINMAINFNGGIGEPGNGGTPGAGGKGGSGRGAAFPYPGEPAGDNGKPGATGQRGAKGKSGLLLIENK